MSAMRHLLPLLLAATAAFAGRPADLPFTRHELDLGANETCALADINGDGRLDIVSGENWYAAPTWKKQRFRELGFASNYIDAFSDLPLDVDEDGAIDIITVTWFGKKLSWYRNPGKAGGTWKETVFFTGHNTEFAFLVDLDNDGKARELLPQFGGLKSPLTWFEFRKGQVIPHQVSDSSFGHGIGAGDINADRRNDIITPKGWFEAPADPRSGTWTWHADFADHFGKDQIGFQFIVDLNKDGRPDMLTTFAHNYGIFWLERQPDGSWAKRMIDDSWSQAHAVTWQDMNGDGQPDLLTGKRYMAHNGKDPGEREPLGIYWYEYRAQPDGKLEWIRHVIDYASRTGGGMQMPIADLDGDGDFDFVAPGKSGLYLFENLTRSRSR
jgi:hypothetical protein